MIYWLDCDLNGTAPVQNFIDEGLVKHLPCGTFQDFDIWVRKLMQLPAGPKDTVVVDTITTLMLTTISDAKLGTDENEELWEKRVKFLNDPQYLSVYNMGTQFIRARLRNMRKRGINLIITAHEDDGFDPSQQIKKRAPQAPPALLDALVGLSSDIGRLTVAYEDIANPESGEVLVKKDQRILQIRMDDSVLAKYKVQRGYSGTVPKRVIVENVGDWAKALGGTVPECAVLYGAPGSGKTSLACSGVPIPVNAASIAPAVTTPKASTSKAAVATTTAPTQSVAS